MVTRIYNHNNPVHPNRPITPSHGNFPATSGLSPFAHLRPTLCVCVPMHGRQAQPLRAKACPFVARMNCFLAKYLTTPLPNIACCCSKWLGCIYGHSLQQQQQRRAVAERSGSLWQACSTVGCLKLCEEREKLSKHHEWLHPCTCGLSCFF